MESQTLSIQALSKSLADEKEKREQCEAALEDSKKREDFLRSGMAAMQASIEQIEAMLSRNRAEWQEMGEMNAKGKKVDSVVQKALSMNQLKEENRKLTAKVGGEGEESRVAGDCKEANDELWVVDWRH